MSKKGDDIERIVVERCLNQDVPESRVVAVRADVARELLAKETVEYRKSLQAECEEMIEQERAEYESAPAKVTVTPITQERYVAGNNFVHDYTNCFTELEISSPLWFSLY